MQTRHALALTALLAAGACGLGVLAGSTGIGAASPEIFWQIRVPRVLAGFGAGAALALAGRADATADAQRARRSVRARRRRRRLGRRARHAARRRQRPAARSPSGASPAARPPARSSPRVLLFAPARAAPRRPGLDRARGQLDGAAAGRRDDRLGLLGDRLAHPEPRRPGPAARHGVLAARRPERRGPLGDRLDRAGAGARRRLADARASSTGWRAATPGRRRSASRSAGGAC